MNCKICQKPVRNITGDRCEDCYADAAARWSGRSQRVPTDGHARKDYWLWSLGRTGVDHMAGTPYH